MDDSNSDLDKNRREKKSHRQTAKSPRLIECAKEEYRTKDLEVKRNARGGQESLYGETGK